MPKNPPIFFVIFTKWTGTYLTICLSSICILVEALPDQQLVIEEANVSLIREGEYLWANKAEIGVDLCFRFNL